MWWMGYQNFHIKCFLYLYFNTFEHWRVGLFSKHFRRIMPSNLIFTYYIGEIYHFTLTVCAKSKNTPLNTAYSTRTFRSSCTCNIPMSYFLFKVVCFGAPWQTWTADSLIRTTIVFTANYWYLHCLWSGLYLNHIEILQADNNWLLLVF